MLIVRKPKEGVDPAAPFVKPVLGAKVLFAPIDRTMLLRARRAARAAIGAPDDGADQTAEQMLDELGDAWSRALITEGVKDWWDVVVMVDEDDEGAGETLPFTAENLALALSDPVTFDAFDVAYVVPFVTRERERAEPGNASAVSPNGTGGAATPDSGSATSAAPPAPGAAATSARTRSTDRKPRRKKPSGGR